MFVGRRKIHDRSQTKLCFCLLIIFDTEMATTYKKTIKKTLPKFYLGGDTTQSSAWDSDLSSANPYLKAGQYGAQAASAYFPKDKQYADLTNSTNQGRTNTGVDNTLSAASQFTPTKGTITSLGQTAGDTIQNKMQNKTGSVLGGAVKYGAAGAELGEFAGPLGSAVGAGIGTVYGSIEGGVEYGQIQKAKDEQTKEKRDNIQRQLAGNYQSAINQGFKIKGNQDVSYQKYGGLLKKGMYKAGGDLSAEKAKTILREGVANRTDLTDKQKRFFGAIAGGEKPYKKADGGEADGAEYEAEKNEVVQGDDAKLEDGKQVASDMHVVGGDRHEDGGTMGQGGDRVFSDRIQVSPEFSSQMKSSGFGDGQGKTYAETAAKLGKLKGKYEALSGSTQPYRYNTAKQMLPRIEALTNALFESQEQEKKTEENKVMAMGGNISGGKGSSYTMPNGDLRKGDDFPKKRKRHDMGGEISSPGKKYEMNDEFVSKANEDYFNKRVQEIGQEEAEKERDDFLPGEEKPFISSVKTKKKKKLFE